MKFQETFNEMINENFSCKKFHEISHIYVQACTINILHMYQ